MAVRVVRTLRILCPQCGRESSVQLREDALAAAAASPTGLVGVADYHGDHVLVVYVDGEGRDRGVRVFRVLQRGEVVRVNPAYLAYMSNLSGFRVTSGGWSVECFAGSPEVLLRLQEGGGALELELRDLSAAPRAAGWGRGLLEAVARVGEHDPAGLLLSMLLLDASLPNPPSPFAARMFEVALKSRRLVVRFDPDAAELLRLYVGQVPWLSARSIEFAQSVSGWRLIDAVVGPDPLTMRERLMALLSLERRGVVGFEEVGP